MHIDGPRFDPSLLAILRTATTDAATGEVASRGADSGRTEGTDSLDPALLRSLQLNATRDAAATRVDAEDAQRALATIMTLLTENPGLMRAAQGAPDTDRVRGLLGG